MKLGAFTVADVDPDDPRSNPDRVREVADLAATADRVGLASFWVAEHHFSGGGACASPPVLLAAAGGRTSRIRLGSLVSVLPFHRGVDVAEEYALLDRLIDGRLNFGIGSGYLPAEFGGFGIDPTSKRDRFETVLGTVLAAFSGEPFLAGPEAPAPVRLSVLPVQRPYPPVWVAAQRREAVPFIARRGFGVGLIPYATVADLTELARVVRDYRAALPAGQPGSVIAAVHVYAGDRPEQARAAFARYLDARLRTHSTFYEQKTHRAPELARPEALERADLAVFGSPQDVARRLRRYADAGVDELLGLFDFGGLPAGEAAASMTALAGVWTDPEG